MSAVDPYARIADVLSHQPASLPTPPIRSYAALGDSFTAGTGCAPGEGWADILAERLGSGVHDFAYRNLAFDGATSSDVLEQLGPALQIEPDLVTVVCGANDVLFSVRPDPGAYARRLAAIFRRLRDPLPSVRIVTATAPERWDFLELGPRTQARLARGIVHFNAATRTVARAYGIPCLEVAGHPGLSDPSNFIADGLHPSARGHEQAAAAFGALLGSEEET
jgi:lysophospholipase L1-like esterase